MTQTGSWNTTETQKKGVFSKMETYQMVLQRFSKMKTENGQTGFYQMEADDLDKESSSGVACKEKSGKNDLNTEWE